MGVGLVAYPLLVRGSSPVSGALRLDLCILALSNKSLDDSSLAENLRDAPSNAIVLLEDVDAIFTADRVAKPDAATGVTFSGLLNALDGVASQVCVMCV